jgi:hypothetical protein
MPVHQRIQSLETHSPEIIDEWVRQIHRNPRFVRLKNVPEWRLRGFGLAVMNRLTQRLAMAPGVASKRFHFGHLRLKQWVPVSEFVGCLLVLRREVFSSADVGRGRFLDPDTSEFRALADRFFDDFLAWRRWEQD